MFIVRCENSFGHVFKEKCFGKESLDEFLELMEGSNYTITVEKVEE